jgi:tRNA A37 threonylcarbamoyladenosine dehydratase
LFDFTQRTELLIGSENVEKLSKSSVLVFGVGGVGSYCVEALARAGVGKITLFDGDKVNSSNINRQLIALHSTVGMYKCEVARQRILDINPEAQVEVFNEFYTAENADCIEFGQYDYIADAIDMVSSKLLIIEKAHKAGVPVICAMGAANRLDPTGFKVTDIYKTTDCPLAKVMRRELRKRNILKQKVVFSSEATYKHFNDTDKVLGSISFVPSVAGLIIASEVVRDTIKM